jgi:penicillin-binding protein 1A
MEEPYPLPGSERMCTCGRALAISYPMGLVDALRRKGSRFEGDDGPSTSNIASVRAPPGVPSPPRLERTEQTRLERRPLGAAEPTEPAVAPAAAEGTAATSQLPRPVRRPAEPLPPPTTKRLPPARPKPRGRLRRWLLGGFASSLVMGVGLVVAVALAVGGVFWYYGRELPSVETLSGYRPPTVTTVFDQGGQLMGEIYEKRRYVVPLDTIPPVVRNAFIAAEDAAFYEHDGVDYFGIVRALGRNAMQGKKAQGASTITQQVARNFLLSNEKTYARKIKEVLLSWRIEDTFPKDHILYLYLNQIYLGSSAYGVEAAARVYFGKHVGELDLAEAAMIAGLPQRPSDYSPHRHPEKAKARQHYVLEQMVDNAFITEAEAETAAARPLDIVARTNEFLLKAPWFTEQVRRHVVEAYGVDRVNNDGLVVETTCDLALQQVAQKAVTDGVQGTDEKVGWRGADETLAEADIPAKLAELEKKTEEYVEGQRYPAVLTRVEKTWAEADLGDGSAIVPLKWTEWAYKPDPARNAKYRRQDDLRNALHVGDVVRVEVRNLDFRKAPDLAKFEDAGTGPWMAAELYQAPEIQGALYSFRLADGAVIAMVGGVDFKDTQFNRAIQAQRQVGSTFKPIVYAAAIASRRFTSGTIVQDAPIVMNTLHSQLWKPENYGEDYLGDITLRKALALSRNVVTIRVLDTIGIDPVYKLARDLGITSPMDQDLSMGLGSASLTMVEIARAYSAFATGGRKVEPHLIDRVLDRDGKVLEAWKAPAEWPRVMDAGAASVTHWLLTEVASNGTAAKAQKLGLHVAGKTGTTNDFRDAWFVGYTPDVLTAVWVGYDQPKSLGASSTGGFLSLPIWMEYTEKACPKAKDRAFTNTGGVVWATIDESTGRPIAGGRSMPFLPGTTPSGAAVEAGQTTSEELLTSGEW